MYPFRYSGDFSKFLIDLEIVITTNLKRGQVGMKKYKLTDNISFLASVMRQASKSFLCVCAVAHFRSRSSFRILEFGFRI